jgi:hypothetical protein
LNFGGKTFGLNFGGKTLRRIVDFVRFDFQLVTLPIRELKV